LCVRPERCKSSGAIPIAIDRGELEAKFATRSLLNRSRELVLLPGLIGDRITANSESAWTDIGILKGVVAVGAVADVSRAPV